MLAISLAAWIGYQQRPRERPAPREEAAEYSRKECARRLAAAGRALAMYAAEHEGVYPVLRTPAAVYEELLPLLAPYGVTRTQLVCPTSETTEGPEYVYHSYRGLGQETWPKWMEEKRAVTTASPPETWLLADYLGKDRPGPHAETGKAFNYLRADGAVRYHKGAPRQVYR